METKPARSDIIFITIKKHTSMLNLRNRKKVERPFKYYCFMVGFNENDAKTWNLDQIFLPALDHYHALQLYTVLTKKPKKNKITFDFSHSPTLVHAVLEYEKVRHIRNSIVQFKLLREIKV